MIKAEPCGICHSEHLRAAAEPASQTDRQFVRQLFRGWVGFSSEPTGKLAQPCMASMQVALGGHQSRLDVQELNVSAKHDDATRFSIIACVAVLKGVGALERQAPFFVS